MSFLRRLLPVSLLLASATLGFAAPAAVGVAPTNPSGFVIHRGTNLSHWLSQDFGWAPREEWTTENDIRYIASLGFDHVRLPVDEKELWNEDGAPNEKAFALLISGLEWCRAAKLRVILDLHTVRAHHFNAGNEGGPKNTLWTDPAAQDRFLDLWRQLSTRLHSYPNDFLAYEVMNEPTAPDFEDWNKLVARSVEFIRSVEPERVVVLGANMWQIPQNLPKLKVPAGDRNIILSMHTYTPLLLTHHKAAWTDPAIRDFAGPVAYPGPVVTKDVFKKHMASFPPALQIEYIDNSTDNWGPARFREEYEPAIARAKELGLQLYCGEFGCLPTVPRKDRLAYYRDVVGVFEANGIAWANWEYKGDFGITEWHGLKSLDGAPDVQLIDALLQR
jgi:endoglucanase